MEPHQSRSRSRRAAAACAILAVLLAGHAPGHAQGSLDDESGARGRAELAALVERCTQEAAAVALESVGLEAKERALGIDLHAVRNKGLRVLSTDGEEEARKVAKTLLAAQALFNALTASSTAYPAGCCAYLLTKPDEKTVFLSRHPALSPGNRERLAKLDGAGLPGTADWAFWEGDAEKRLDGMVRTAFDWLGRTAYGVTLEQHPWLHEGLGIYLTQALVGTHLTWFEPPRAAPAGDAAATALDGEVREPDADWPGLARALFAPEAHFDLEELFHLGLTELDAADHLRAFALAAYLVEMHRAALPVVLQRVGAGEDPRAVLEEALGTPFAELRTRLHAWLVLRETALARAAGRRTESELVALWGSLTPTQKNLGVEGFKKRVAELSTPQLKSMRALLRSAPKTFPLAEAAPFYDPKVHAPAQPIPRKRLASGDARAKKLVAEVRPEPAPSAITLAYDYDWARDRVVRLKAGDESERLFQNGLRGVPPDADLARALVLKELDLAAERKLQVAFAHAYTDREGNVFPLTLFEMWASGMVVEMPDVDALGIVHDVLDEWKRWVAPVPGTQHDPLYKVLGELFKNARRSRELRETCADLLLFPAPPVMKGYETLRQNLHALWASQESQPGKLARVLPDGKQWEGFLGELVSRCKRDPALYSSGRKRASDLRKDGEAVRMALGAALDEAALAVEAPAEPGAR